MTSTSRRLALLVCLCTSALSHAQRAELPAPAGFSVGETWEWRQVDGRTQLEEGKLTRTVVNVDGVLQFSNGTANSQMAAALVDGGYKDSSKPWRAWPLEIGKKWVFDADWVRPDGVTGNTRQDVEVVAYEEVVVPAGKFMAYKIEHRGFFRNSSGGRGKQMDTYWYAPDAKADVKHVRNDGYNLFARELVSHKAPP